MINIVGRKLINFENKDDEKISVALMSVFVVLTIQYFVLVYFDLLDAAAASNIQLASKVIVGTAFLYALPEVLQRSKIKLLVVYYIGIFVFLLHYILFTKNTIYILEISLPLFLMSLPAFVFSISLKDWNVLKSYMVKASYIIFFFGALISILVFIGSVSIGYYSMSLSYYMLLPVIIFLDELFEKHSIRAVIMVIWSFFSMLALGSRGPILCIVVFLILKSIKYILHLTYKKTFFLLITSGVTIYFFVNYHSVLGFINTFLFDLGIRSRSIDLFLTEELYFSGRESLYPVVIEATNSAPLIGLGIGGDRQVLDGAYAHNLFLELYANFGVVIGGVLSIALVLIVFKILFIKDFETYNMLIIWLSFGFVRLMVSGSYLTDIQFWIFMGLAASTLFVKNQQPNHSESPNTGFLSLNDEKA